MAKVHNISSPSAPKNFDKVKDKDKTDLEDASAVSAVGIFLSLLGFIGFAALEITIALIFLICAGVVYVGPFRHARKLENLKSDEDQFILSIDSVDTAEATEIMKRVLAAWDNFCAAWDIMDEKDRPLLTVSKDQMQKEVWEAARLTYQVDRFAGVATKDNAVAAGQVAFTDLLKRIVYLEDIAASAGDVAVTVSVSEQFGNLETLKALCQEALIKTEVLKALPASTGDLMDPEEILNEIGRAS